ncbi:MAG: permease [bacterium]|nr:MAG: permease [bacterium]
MLIPTSVFAVLAVVLLLVGYSRGQEQHIAGVRIAFGMIVQVLPLLLFAFLVAGMIQVLIPREYILRWIGAEAGFKGILIGSVAGGLTPGGPFVNLPLAAALYRSGAGVGTMVAFLTGWSLWAVARLPMEIGFLGWRLTAIRIFSTLLFPPLAGIIAHIAFRA